MTNREFKRHLHEKRLEKMWAEAQAEKKAPQSEKPKPNVRKKA